MASVFPGSGDYRSSHTSNINGGEAQKTERLAGSPGRKLHIPIPQSTPEVSTQEATLRAEPHCACSGGWSVPKSTTQTPPTRQHFRSPGLPLPTGEGRGRPSGLNFLGVPGVGGMDSTICSTADFRNFLPALPSQIDGSPWASEG